MYKLDSRYMGSAPDLNTVIAAPASLRLLPMSAGAIVWAEDPVWGPGEFIFARAGGTISKYNLCVLTPVWDATNRTFQMNMTAVPNTANLGRALYVNQGGDMTAGQYGWFMASGITPVNCNASVAADTTFGIAAAGQGGANSAGKQVLNARVVQAATATVVAAATGKSGDNVISFPQGFPVLNGFFVGGYLSGTNVGASAVVNFVDPFQQYIIASVNNSGVVSGNVTQTNNNATIFYNEAVLNRSFAQGAIT